MVDFYSFAGNYSSLVPRPHYSEIFRGIDREGLGRWQTGSRVNPFISPSRRTARLTVRSLGRPNMRIDNVLCISLTVMLALPLFPPWSD